MIRSIYIAFISLIILGSCGEMREEITIQSNGSGTYDISSDMIPMMRSMMEGFAKMSDSEDEELDSAALAAKVDEMLWKDFGDEIDSIMSFDEKLPEEIANDPEKMALIENAQMYMRGGRTKGYLKTGLTYSFNNVDDFRKFMELSEESTRGDQKAGILFGDFETTIKMTSTSFFRSTTKTKSDEEEDKPNLDDLNAMFKDLSIVTVINTPKKIKSLDVKTYEIVEQQAKSVTLRYRLEDIVSDKPTEILIKW